MKDKISLWWNLSINPFFGCRPCSPGCHHCWAAASFWDDKNDRPKEGRESLVHRNPKYHNIEWTGQLQMNKNYPLQLMDIHKLPPGSIVAVEFMGDLFLDHPILDHPIANTVRDGILKLAHDHHEIYFVLITKRPERIKQVWPGLFQDLAGKYPNIWIVASASNQEEVQKAYLALYGIKAKVVGLSLEPMLDEVLISEYLDLFNWIILGAERCRPFKLARRFHLRWAYKVITDCIAANVPVFYKYGEDGGGQFTEAPVVDQKRWLMYPKCRQDPKPLLFEE